ncbi:MAG: ABC transporter permease subunit [Pyrinomonadaceae bacterium]|nr:ABC transporter permease subunit [Pyrinomonadaceae bacterium]
MRPKYLDSVNIKITIALFATVIGFPFFWILVQSFASGWRFPVIVPAEFDIRAWNYLFDSSSGVSIALLNSLIIAFLVTIIAIILALPAARAIAFYDFYGKNLVLFCLILPILSPSISIALGGHALFLRLELTDSYSGVIISHLIPTLPYCILTLIGGFSRLNVDFESQARSLGASNLQVFRFVTLPLIVPSLMVSAFFAFLISWSQYLTTLLIGGGKIVTLPLVLVNFQRGGDENVTAALTLVFLLPSILFLAITARQWREI